MRVALGPVVAIAASAVLGACGAGDVRLRDAAAPSGSDAGASKAGKTAPVARGA